MTMIILKVELNLHLFINLLYVCLCIFLFLYSSVCVLVCACMSICFLKQILCIGPNLAAERVRVREEGQVVRDNLRENMPGPTRRERRLLNFV